MQGPLRPREKNPPEQQLGHFPRGGEKLCAYLVKSIQLENKQPTVKIHTLSVQTNSKIDQKNYRIFKNPSLYDNSPLKII